MLVLLLFVCCYSCFVYSMLCCIGCMIIRIKHGRIDDMGGGSPKKEDHWAGPAQETMGPNHSLD